MKRSTLTLSTLLVLAAICSLTSADTLAADELTHQGKSVSYWVAALEPSRSIAPQPKQAQAEEAIHALGPDAIPSILKYQEKNREQRLGLIRHACAILEPEGDFKLVEALHDGDAAVRETALEVLPKTVIPGALPDIVGLLADPVRPVRTAAILSLVRLAPDREETIAALVEALHDFRATPAKAENDFSRDDAALTLGTLGPKAKAAVADLMTLLTDPSDETREAAATALWRIERNTQVVPVLVDRLESARDYQTCLRVMKVLAEMGPLAKAAVPSLRRKMDDSGVSFVPPTVNFGQAVVDTLTKIDPTAAAEARKKLADLSRENP